MIEKFLELPEITPIKPVNKSMFIDRPDVSMLTEEQLEIFNVITNLPLKTFSQSLLTGYGGTGKTFLTTKIIEEIISKRGNVKIAITAPTNKAVKVLKNLSLISELHPRVDFNTLHSLLKLKLVITEDGREEFKADVMFDDTEEYDIVIVDEVSMLDNSLYLKLLDKAKRHKIVLLFIGDRGQIPPVNGGESVLFKLDLENNFNLTKIIRQSNGNPIIGLAQKIRNNEKYATENVINEQNNGVMYLKINTEMPLLEIYFNSVNFEKDPNFVKVLGYTNKCVDYYNDRIREIIYGKNCGKLCVGEKMVCNKPILEKNRVILNNNDEFEVVSFELKRENTGYKFHYYNIEILSDEKTYTIKVLAEQSKALHTEAVEKLKEAAKSTYVMNRKAAWVKYYKLLDKYADVKYNYALTVHKSQGSTFDNAIVIKCDINRVFNYVERNKLLYTAVTRAKNRLFVI